MLTSWNKQRNEYNCVDATVVNIEEDAMQQLGCNETNS